jgi:hypothetical protein
MSAFQRLIGRSLNKPLKIDVRDHCEYNVQGCISRTFDIPRRELITLLSSDEGNLDVVDRIDVNEFPDEDRCVMYNPSRMDGKAVSEVRARARNVTHWDPEGQYGEWSARSL